MSPLMSFDDVVQRALMQLQDGDITGYTMEGLMREFRFASGVLLGYRVAGAVTTKQYVEATGLLRSRLDRLMQNYGGWFELAPDSAWEDGRE